MASHYKTNIKKAIFQIRTKPRLDKFINIFNISDLTNYFPHWETDRVFLTVKDFEKKHSLVFKADSITYESDDYKFSELEKIINLIKDKKGVIYENEDIIRLGIRFQTLSQINNLSFDELVEILNLKILNSTFAKLINQISDNSFVFDINLKDEIKCKVQFGPMKKKEVEQYISPNVKNHFDPTSVDRLLKIHEIFRDLPENNLFIDLDISTTDKIDVDVFLSKAITEYNKLIEEIKSYILKQSI